MTERHCENDTRGVWGACPPSDVALEIAMDASWGASPILFGTVVARMDEHDSYCKKAVFTRRNRYGEAVVLQSPGSRSAPWDRMDDNVYPEGVAQGMCFAGETTGVTPLG